MKRILIAILGVIMSLTLISCGSTDVTPSEKTQPPTDKTVVESNNFNRNEDDELAFDKPSEKLENLEKIDAQITEALVAEGYTIEHASLIQEVLNKVGVEEIELDSMTGKPEEGLNSVVCYPNGYTEEDRRLFFTTDAGVIFYAGFLGEDLYDSGEYLKMYTDVHVPEKEITMDVYGEIQEFAAQSVKSCLNYPNSADFGAFDWAAGRSDDKYMVTGKLQAKNGFGVKSDVFFTVWLKSENGSYVLEGVALDGVRVK